MNKRLIAINLPQFHPFKENDEWWGKGFTEWTNVVKAHPRFKGHYQPHLPADTGFYDLRLPEAREMQADMARKYGIYGFCYYHYWFNGKQLMERPINEIVESGQPNFPFMLCWANENWTRAWNGETKEILIEQKYSHQDDIEHIDFLCKNIFKDPRYIKINGKPFFAVYRPNSIPNIAQTLSTWRTVAKKYGLDLYLGFMRPIKGQEESLIKLGFDVSIDFQPHMEVRKKWWLDLNAWIDCFREHVLKKKNYIMPTLFDYNKYVDIVKSQANPNYKQFPGITPSWDNAARRIGKSFYALTNSTPSAYGKWLQYILDTFTPYSTEENFVFVNAWNEWAEGNHLEPDQKWGLNYLEETKKQLDKNNI